MEQLKPGDPSRVGNYRLIGRLGEGGMGQVFLGLSPGGRQVAVKVIHPGYASGKQFRERFAREIEAARRVGGFHTASVVDADPGADPPWMVTAFIQGPSLQQAVAEGGPFGLERVCRLGAGLAEGLAAIHACGLVHRDLKPSNVILADDGPRIIDFGISRAAEASPMTTAGMVVGTYSYMSPEQLRGELAGPASDVFALGCTLAFAATARITFGDDSIVTVVYHHHRAAGPERRHRGARLPGPGPGLPVQVPGQPAQPGHHHGPAGRDRHRSPGRHGRSGPRLLAFRCAGLPRRRGNARARGACRRPGTARARAGAATAAALRRGRGTAAGVSVRRAAGAQAVPAAAQPPPGAGSRARRAAFRASGIAGRGAAAFRAGGIPVRGRGRARSGPGRAGLVGQLLRGDPDHADRRPDRSRPAR